MSSDIFVFAARDTAPDSETVQAVAANMQNVHVEVDARRESLLFQAGELTYVESVLGEFRIDAITYQGGALPLVADLLERCYATTKALADTDADGVFTLSELVLLIRASGEASFHTWADPRDRTHEWPA